MAGRASVPEQYNPRGADETYERVFRLLRWMANRPEPLGSQQP